MAKTPSCRRSGLGASDFPALLPGNLPFRVAVDVALNLAELPEHGALALGRGRVKLPQLGVEEVFEVKEEGHSCPPSFPEARGEQECPLSFWQITWQMVANGAGLRSKGRGTFLSSRFSGRSGGQGCLRFFWQLTGTSPMAGPMLPPRAIAPRWRVCDGPFPLGYGGFWLGNNGARASFPGPGTVFSQQPLIESRCRPPGRQRRDKRISSTIRASRGSGVAERRQKEGSASRWGRRFLQNSG